MCCINTHLTKNLLTLNKYCVYDLLYMIVTLSEIKRCTTKCFLVQRYVEDFV